MDTMNNTASQVRQSIQRVRGDLLTERKKALRHEVLDALAREPGLTATVYLFGSWATERFDGQSDTDLLVIASDSSTANQAQHRLMSLADDVVSMTESDWVRQRQSSHPFISRVAEERILLVDTRMNIETRYPLGDAEDPPYELFNEDVTNRASQVADRVVSVAKQAIR